MYVDVWFASVRPKQRNYLLTYLYYLHKAISLQLQCDGRLREVGQKLFWISVRLWAKVH